MHWGGTTATNTSMMAERGHSDLHDVCFPVGSSVLAICLRQQQAPGIHSTWLSVIVRFRQLLLATRMFRVKRSIGVENTIAVA